ncbi:MAG: glutathione S-transferase family protein [Pseudomonadota bacterium]
MSKLAIYGDPISGNCLKTKWTADYLGLDYAWTSIDIMAGDTRTDEFLKINPFGQTPAAVLADGKVVTQSNAIMVYFAEASGDNRLLPTDPFERAEVFRWLFWEQNSHEPYIAGRRFRKAFKKLADAEIDAEWLPRGYAALGLMEETLQHRDYLALDHLTLADIAVVAYTRWAGEGGFDLANYPKVRAWIARIERELDIPKAEAA